MSVLQTLPRHWFLQQRIKLQHLKLLAAMGQYHTLHRASHEIGISQPAASKLVADLEAAVQQALFERRGRVLVPNTLGEVLIRRSQAMIRELESASDELQALAEGRRGRVSIGAIDGPVVNYLANMLATLRIEHPHIEVQVETGSSIHLARLLQQKEVDLVLGRITPELRNSDFTYREAGQERFAVVGRRDHPLVQAAPQGVEQLRAQDWVVQNRGSTLRVWFETLFSDNNISLPDHIVNTNSLLMTLAYLARTDALCVLSEPVALQQAAFGQLGIVPVSVDVNASPYGLLLPAKQPVSPALSAVLTLLATELNISLD